MGWTAYLSHLEEVLELAEVSIERGELERAADLVAGLTHRGPSEHLPALAPGEADRARAAAGRLATVEGAAMTALQRLRPELDLLAAAQPAERRAIFLDHRG